MWGFGARSALAFGFLMSGLVHDLVISFPAGGGWGGPTAFFVIQGMLIFVERSRWGRAIGMGRGPLGRVVTMGVLLLTAGMLFHRPFIENVILPFFEAMGA